jgi:hypothetical protein
VFVCACVFILCPWPFWHVHSLGLVSPSGSARSGRGVPPRVYCNYACGRRLHAHTWAHTRSNPPIHQRTYTPTHTHAQGPVHFGISASSTHPNTHTHTHTHKHTNTHTHKHTHRGQSTLGSVHEDKEGNKWSLCLYPNGDNLSREGQLGVFVKVKKKKRGNGGVLCVCMCICIPTATASHGRGVCQGECVCVCVSVCLCRWVGERGGQRGVRWGCLSR